MQTPACRSAHCTPSSPAGHTPRPVMPRERSCRLRPRRARARPQHPLKCRAELCGITQRSTCTPLPPSCRSRDGSDDAPGSVEGVRVARDWVLLGAPLENQRRGRSGLTGSHHSYPHAPASTTHPGLTARHTVALIGRGWTLQVGERGGDAGEVGEVSEVGERRSAPPSVATWRRGERWRQRGRRARCRRLRMPWWWEAGWWRGRRPGTEPRSAPCAQYQSPRAGHTVLRWCAAVGAARASGWCAWGLVTRVQSHV